MAHDRTHNGNQGIVGLRVHDALAGCAAVQVTGYLFGILYPELAETERFEAFAIGVSYLGVHGFDFLLLLNNVHEKPKPVRKPPLLRQPVHLLSQPFENQGFGKVYHIQGNIQFRGHFRRFLARHDPLKGLPGGRRKLALHDGQEVLRDVPVVFSIPKLRKTTARVCQLRKNLVEKITVPRGCGTGSLCPPEVTKPVDQNATEPVPEPTFPRVIMKTRHLSNDDLKNLLDQILRILRLNRVSSQPS